MSRYPRFLQANLNVIRYIKPSYSWGEITRKINQSLQMTENNIRIIKVQVTSPRLASANSGEGSIA